MSERTGSERASGKGRPDAETWIVDRVEGSIAVLVAAEDPYANGEPVVVEVAAELLGTHAVEGAVLRVPLGEVGEPVWESAERDLAAEEALREEGEAIIERLKRRDPGGDVIL